MVVMSLDGLIRLLELISLGGKTLNFFANFQVFLPHRFATFDTFDRVAVFSTRNS